MINQKVKSTDYKFIKCGATSTGITWNLWSKTSTGNENVRTFSSTMWIKLIDPNFALNYQSTGVDAKCSDSTIRGGSVTAPLGFCRGDSSKLYYFSNYIGASSNGKPLPWNSRIVQKTVLYNGNSGATNPSTDVLNAWGYFSGSTYNYRDCSAIPTLSDTKTTFFPVGSILYCANNQKIFRITDVGNRALEITSNAVNMKVWVPNWTTLTDMKTKASNTNCAFNTNGNRVGACTLPEEIQRIATCPTFTIAKRQSSTTTENTRLADGQYYGCANDGVGTTAKPKKVYQYDESDNSLRLIAPPDASSSSNPSYLLWQELVRKLPDLDDCNGYLGYPPLLRKRSLIPDYSNMANPPVAFKNLGLYCLSSCSPDGAELLGSGSCHATGTDGLFISNRRLDTSNDIKPACLQELLISCSNLLDQNYCPGVPSYTYPCPTDLSTVYKAQCRNLFQRVLDTSVHQPIYRGCSHWLTTKSVPTCNAESSKFSRTYYRTFDAPRVLQAFLVDDQSTPVTYRAAN